MFVIVTWLRGKEKGMKTELGGVRFCFFYWQVYLYSRVEGFEKFYFVSYEGLVVFCGYKDIEGVLYFSLQRF